jgi:hypothetical protein
VFQFGSTVGYNHDYTSNSNGIVLGADALYHLGQKFDVAFQPAVILNKVKTESVNNVSGLDLPLTINYILGNKEKIAPFFGIGASYLLSLDKNGKSFVPLRLNAGIYKQFNKFALEPQLTFEAMNGSGLLMISLNFLGVQ